MLKLYQLIIKYSRFKMNWWVHISKIVKPQFSIFGIRFYYYGLIIGLSIVIALWIMQLRSKKYQITRNELESVIWWALIPGLVGARIYHVIDNFSYYFIRPFDVVAVWKGGMAIYGALIGGLLGLIYASKLNKVRLLSLLDLAAPAVILGQAIGRWGNFFNQEAFGPPTNLPWKIYISPANRLWPYLEADYFHPLFLYEFLFNLISFFILLMVSRKSKLPGSVVGWYMILYGTDRFIIEFGRLDTAIIWGIKVAHILSLFIIILGVIMLLRRQLSSILIKSTRSSS